MDLADRYDMTDHADRALRIAPIESHDPTDSSDNADPMLNAEPTDPMLNADPTEPMLATEATERREA